MKKLLIFILFGLFLLSGMLYAQVGTIPTVTGSNSGDGEIKAIVAAAQTNDDILSDSVIALRAATTLNDAELAALTILTEADSARIDSLQIGKSATLQEVITAKFVFWNEATQTYSFGDTIGFGGTGSGSDVFKVGTPVNDQVGVWTGDGTLEGDADLTFDGSDLTTTGSIIVGGTVDGVDVAAREAINSTQLQDSLGYFADYTIELVGDSVWAFPGLHKSFTAYRDTNLTSVITSAMSELSSGGLVQIGAGLYDHLSTIVMPYDNIKIEGSGSRATKLKIKGDNDVGAASGHLFFVNGKDNISFINLDMDGNKLNQTKLDTRDGNPIARSAGVYGYDTVSFGQTDNLLVEDCHIHEFAMSGIIVAEGSDPLIHHCTFTENGWDAFEFYGGVTRGVFDNNLCIDNTLGSTLSHGTTISNSYMKNPWNINTWATPGNKLAFTLEGTGEGPNDVIIENCVFEGDSIFYGIYSLDGSNNLKIDNVTIRGSVLADAIAINLIEDTASVVTNCNVYDFTGNGSVGLQGNASLYSVYSNNVFRTIKQAGIILAASSDNNVIKNNYVYNVDDKGIYLLSGADNNVVLNNMITAYTAIQDAGADNIKINNYNFDSNWRSMLPDVVKNNWAHTATSDGTGTGIITPGAQNITVTSANADYICALPAASATTIGTVITGTVGANGFELRVAASQATSVYLNNVTTNVEAAIPASSNFKVTQIDATHWILEATTNLGAVITAIVPNAV